MPTIGPLPPPGSSNVTPPPLTPPQQFLNDTMEQIQALRSSLQQNTYPPDQVEKITSQIQTLAGQMLTETALNSTQLSTAVQTAVQGFVDWANIVGTDMISIPPSDSNYPKPINDPQVQAALTHFNSAATALNNAIFSNVPPPSAPTPQVFLNDTMDQIQALLASLQQNTYPPGQIEIIANQIQGLAGQMLTETTLCSTQLSNTIQTAVQKFVDPANVIASDIISIPPTDPNYSNPFMDPNVQATLSNFNTAALQLFKALFSTGS